MTQQPILIEISHSVATITLNRPEVHNAFDEEMIFALDQAITQMAANTEVKILLLRGNGKNFSAGANLDSMRKMSQLSEKENKKEAKALADLMFHLAHFPKPTIVLVQGATFGGGIGLIACCQIALVSHQATFCFSEAKLGLIPAVISPYIVNAIGVRQARALFLTAEKFDAKQAYQMGLCYDVVATDELDKRAREVILSLLQNGPQALKEINTLMTTFQAIKLTPEITDFTAQKIAQLRASTEGLEGINAFLEKREPSWRNKNDAR